jgi:outer membrane receptor protein involved in Fe transport
MTRLARTLTLLVVLVPALAAGQAADAILTGAVKDTTGGVLPGATVTARNVATNETRSVVSSAEGAYRITNLPRGRYEVKAELQGFKTIAQSDVLLTVGDTVRLDFALEVGALSELVTVTSQAALVNTEEGRISSLVDEKRVSELPLNGRNAFQLIEMQPGAIANPGSSVLGGSAGGNSAFVNGQRNRANNFMLDGTDNNDQFTAGRPAVNPNVDMIQEFRVLANNFSAEFGRNSASVVNVVTKSGTNSLHGTAYDFLRNDALDAKAVFAPRKDPLRFNQFGATTGGPVKRDRTFFFASYEGLRQTRGVTLVRTVETPEFRQLVAQRFPNSIANFLFQRFPSPTPTSNIRDTGQPVRGLGTDNRLNTPSIASDPNYALTSGNLYRNVLQATPDGIPDLGTANIPISEKKTGDQFSFRIDQELTSNMRLLGRYTEDQILTDDKGAGSTVTGRHDGFNQPVDELGRNFTAAHTYVISNTTVNEARFGLSYRSRGLTAMNEGVPQINFDDGMVQFGNLATNPAVFTQKTFHWVDTMSMSKGDHALKFGAEVRHIRDDSDFAVRRGSYAFLNIHDFAMDEVSRVTNMGINPGTGLIEPNIRNFRFWESGIFFQDDWKVRPTLTLNLGLRHEWFGRPSEANGKLTNIILGPGADIFEQVRTATVGGVDQVVPNDFNNFAPRLGFSWVPLGNNKLAIRGGYGIAYERLFNNSITNIRFNPPYYAFAVADPASVASHFGIPIAYGPMNPDGTRRNEAPTIEGANHNIGVQDGLGIVGNIIGWNGAFGTSQQSLRVPDPNTKDAYTHNWFVGAQTEIRWGMVVEANYLGNVGRNYGRLVDYNTFPGDRFDGVLNRLNPSFGGINYRAMIARTEYHGLQLQVNKRLQHGFTGQVAYTLGKAWDLGSDVQVGALPVDARNIDLEWAVSDFDVRHRLVINWLWEVPFFREHGGLAGTLLGGWQINGITQLQTGFPFNVFTSSPYPAGDYNGDGVNTDRPNLPSFGLDLPSNNKSAYINGLFTAADFPRPVGNGTLPRNAYIGPGYASTDLSLFKDFALPRWSSTKIQFRAEAFNAFNRVNLQRPNGNLSQGTFGRVTQSFPGRELQFALKLIF